MQFEPGQVFAGYTIERELGRGGMGSVYLAKHPRLPRRDALKMLSTSLSSDDSFRTRFEREADLAAALFHRNIVAVYDRGEYEGQLWIAMQYVEGTDAAHAVTEAGGGLDPARAVHIVTEVGNGLDFAHRAGLLHRDVKPANILLAPGLDPDDPDEPEQVLLTDFGIAKAIDDGDSNLTGTGNMLATLAYASPEQIEARTLTHGVDVYALGCVLYELLTGTVPFVAESPFAKMTAHLTQDPPKPSETQPGLGTSFDAVIAKAMAKKPEDRYQSCRALSRAAAAALKTLTEQSETATVLQPARVAPTVTSGDQPTPTPSRAHTGPRPPFTLNVRRYFADGRPSQEVGPVDTRNVPMADRTALESLLHEARFFDLPPRLPLERQITGDYLEEITVGAGDRTWTVAYEHQGSRHPLVLDQIAPRLARIAPWHVTSAAPAAYLRTNNAPGNQAWSPNATIGPIGQGGRIDTGPNPTGPMTPMPTTGRMPTGPIPTNTMPTGPHPTTGAPGRTTGGMPSYLAAGPMSTGQTSSGGSTGVHTGIHPVVGQKAVRHGAHPGLIAGLLVALVAIIVVVIIAVNGGFGGGDDDPDAIAAPESITVMVNEDGETVVNWSSVPDATGYELYENGDLVYEGTAREWVGGAPADQEYTVRAVGPDGTSDESTPVVAEASTDPGSWGDAAFMRSAFPNLIPDGPNLAGPDNTSCEVGSSEYLEQPAAVDAIVTCSREDGLVFSLMHFTSADELGAFTTDGVDNQGWFHQDWFYDSAPDDAAGQEYGSQNDVTDPGFIYTTFVQAERSEYLVAVWWPEHDRVEIRRDWWISAPF